MSGNIKHRLEKLEAEVLTSETPLHEMPMDYPPRWLATLDCLLPHLDGELAKAAAECASLLRSAIAAGKIGAHVCYWCHGKLLALGLTNRSPRLPIGVADIEHLRQCLQIDRWRHAEPTD